MESEVEKGAVARMSIPSRCVSRGEQTQNMAAPNPNELLFMPPLSGLSVRFGPSGLGWQIGISFS